MGKKTAKQQAMFVLCPMINHQLVLSLLWKMAKVMKLIATEGSLSIQAVLPSMAVLVVADRAHVIPLAVGEATPVVVVVQTRASQAVVDPLSMRILPLKRLKLLIIMIAVQLYSNYGNFNNKITQ